MTMPRSIQEILDHADERTRQSQDYEPHPGDERPVEEHLLEPHARYRALLCGGPLAYVPISRWSPRSGRRALRSAASLPICVGRLRAALIPGNLRYLLRPEPAFGETRGDRLHRR
jgi:hypothetical protein